MRSDSGVTSTGLQKGTPLMVTVVPPTTDAKVADPADISGVMASLESSSLDEIVRAGARQMLATALAAEVDAYIDAHAGEVDEDGQRLVVRNGYHRPRQ